MSNELLDEVRKISQLLELLAEDKIAERDSKQRDQLLKIAGRSSLTQAAILIMDGTRSQKDIVTSTKINKGNLSTLVGKLLGAGLVGDDKNRPKLTISIPTNFFEVNSNG